MAQILSTLQSEPQRDFPHSQKMQTPSWILSLASTSAFKYLIICLISCMSFSAYLADEMIAATASNLKSQMQLNTKQLSALYSAGFGLNIPVLILGGLAVHRFGARRVAVPCISIILVGVSLFAIIPAFSAKLIGRLIFGVGLEPLELTQDVFLVRWFDRRPNEHPCSCQPLNILQKLTPISFSFALSVTFSVNMLGQLTGLLVLPYISQIYGDIYYAYLLVVAACFFSLLASAVLYSLDRSADDDPTELCAMCTIFHQHPTNLFESGGPDGGLGSNLKSACDRVKRFPASFWLLMLGTAFTLSQQYVFMLFCSDYLHEKWTLSSEEAGRFTAVVYGVALIVSPLFGFLLGKISEPISSAVFGTAIFSLSLLYLALIPSKLSPLPPMIAIGISYAIVPASIWVSVVRSVKSGLGDAEDGLAFAVATATNSTTLLLTPSLLAFLHDSHPEYGYDSVALVISFATLVGMIILTKVDSSTDNLDKSQVFGDSESSCESTPTSSGTSTPRSDSIDAVACV